MLILKPRQIGSSTWCLFDRCWFPAVTTEDTNVVIMAHKEELAKSFISRLNLAYGLLPEDIRMPPGRDENIESAFVFENLRSTIEIGTFGISRKGAAQKIGETCQNFYGTEVADTRVEDIVLTRSTQVVPDEGIIIIDSTANGRARWFFNEVMKALQGDSNYTLYFYAWYQNVECVVNDVPDDFKPLDANEELLIHRRGLTPAQILWKRKKVKDIGELNFRELYPEDPNECFLFSGSPCFSQTDLEHFAKSDGYCKYHWHGKLVEWPRAVGALQRVSTPPV